MNMVFAISDTDANAVAIILDALDEGGSDDDAEQNSFCVCNWGHSFDDGERLVSKFIQYFF